jgi:hypothetical protein
MKRLDEAVLESERRLFFVRIVLAVAFIVVLFGNIYAAYIFNRPAKPLASIEDFTAVASDALCPGSDLVYRYRLAVEQAAVVDIDLNVMRIDPPATMVRSQTRRAIFPRDMTLNVEARFPVPTEDEGGPIVWEPGAYRLVLAVTTPTGRTLPALDSLSFTIQEGCQ